MPYICHPASYFVWLPLPDGVRAESVVSELIQHRISVSTAAPFATTHQIPHAIRIALGSVDLQVLQQALATISYVIGDHIDR